MANKFNYRPLTAAEAMYTYTNSPQISGQCGLIGHLRADMDTDGTGFFSSWFDWRKDRELLGNLLPSSSLWDILKR